MDTQVIEATINEIEAEMKRLTMWQSEPLPDEAYNFREAFGADTMTLAQWLQFVFIPTIRERIAAGGPWPEESEVGVYAAQQFTFVRPVANEPGIYEAQGSMDRREAHLVELLREFDSLFTKK